MPHNHATSSPASTWPAKGSQRRHRGCPVPTKCGPRWNGRPVPLFSSRRASLKGPRRAEINASTMLTSRNLQAEIDSACELIDFWRFNPIKPPNLRRCMPISPSSMWNSSECAARRLRVLGHPVQFLEHRRQPAFLRCYHGQRGRVETLPKFLRLQLPPMRLMMDAPAASSISFPGELLWSAIFAWRTVS